MNHTNLSPIKPAELPKLSGVSITLDIEDKRIRGLTLTDETGTSITIRHQDYGGLRLLAPVSPVEIERYRLHGIAAGSVAIDQTFDTAEAAKEAMLALGGAEGDCALTVEPFKVSEPAPLVGA